MVSKSDLARLGSGAWLESEAGLDCSPPRSDWGRLASIRRRLEHLFLPAPHEIASLQEACVPTDAEFDFLCCALPLTLAFWRDVCKVRIQMASFSPLYCDRKSLIIRHIRHQGSDR